MYRETREFNMKAMLLWTIHDIPAYGIVAGYVTKGYKGCPICAESDNITEVSSPSQKCL